MSAYFHNDLDEQLDVLALWDADSLLEVLRISSEDLLEVPEFRNRAEQWIKENQL